MQSEIKAIIAEHLPAQTAGVMKEFIEKAEATEDELDIANGLIKKQMKIIEDFEKREAKLAEADTKLQDARDIMIATDERRILLDEETRNFRCTLMEKELEMNKLHLGNLSLLVDKVFGHPNVTITRTGQIPVAASEYNAQNMMSGGEMLESVSETESTTEGKS